MALSGTDIFQSDFQQIVGVIEAGSGSIEFTDGDGTTHTLAARNIKFQYSRPLQIQLLQGGKAIISTQKATGGLSIGALLGKDIKAFLAKFGPLCNIIDNDLEVNLTSDIKCTDDALDSMDAIKLSLSNVSAKSLGLSNQTQGAGVSALVQTQIQLLVVNAEFTGITA